MKKLIILAILLLGLSQAYTSTDYANILRTEIGYAVSSASATSVTSNRDVFYTVQPKGGDVYVWSSNPTTPDASNAIYVTDKEIYSGEFIFRQEKAIQIQAVTADSVTTTVLTYVK